jgi:hypothetical protein
MGHVTTQTQNLEEHILNLMRMHQLQKSVMLKKCRYDLVRWGSLKKMPHFDFLSHGMYVL